MALDAALAQQWWDERYERELEHFARKNAYLHEFKDPEDLFQDMVIGVWLKAIELFDPSRVTYVDLSDPKSPDYEAKLKRAFNAIFTTTLQGFLANLAVHKGTGKSQWEQKLKSTDQPIGSEDEGGATLLDVIEDNMTKDPDMFKDIGKMMKAVSRDLRAPLGYLLNNLERGGSTNIWDDIRDRFKDPETGKGWTKTRFLNAIYDEPAFVEWATSI